MNAKGFSLIELIVVMVIVTVLIAIATLNFNYWSKKYDVEKHARELYSDLVQTRLSAMQQKVTLSVFFGPDRYNVFDQDGNLVSSKSLTYQIRNGSDLADFDINTSDVQFNDHGIASKELNIVILPVQTAGDGCVMILAGKTNIGRIDNVGNITAR